MSNYRENNNHQSFKIEAAKGYEVWAKFDTGAEVYEIFLDENGETYIGCADTVEEAKKVARDWLSEQ